MAMRIVPPVPVRGGAEKARQTIMKKLKAAATLLGVAILVSQSGYAQFTFVPNDLYMGFQNAAGGGTQDFIINLGPATNIIGRSAVFDLSGDFSMSRFDAVLGGSGSMMGGVVGALNGTPADVYVTQLRTSNVGNPKVAGLSLTALLKQSSDNSAATTLSQLKAPAAGTNVLDAGKTWEAYVEPTLSANSFLGTTSINPDSPVSPSTVLYEDLWVTTDSGDARGSQGNGFTYLGYFTLDLTGSSPKLTFTSTNVPASLTPTKPVIVSIEKTGNTVTVISSNAVPMFFTYQLQYTASLNPTNWLNVSSVQVATAAWVTNTDANATNSQRFYQIQVQPNTAL
jgi:hypothetical protein